jgi:hypothetical protein
VSGRGPIESVVRVAATPAQAKVFVAMLQAEGIPARVDGDSLADEFAASRRLMNLMGTRVMVPTSSLAQAAEILQPAEVDAEELTRQALAASPEVAPAASPTAAVGTGAWSRWGLLLLLLTGVAAALAW